MRTFLCVWSVQGFLDVLRSRFPSGRPLVTDLSINASSAESNTSMSVTGQIKSNGDDKQPSQASRYGTFVPCPVFSNP